MSGRGTATVQRPRRGRAARAKELRSQRAQIALPAAVGACSIGGTACAAREPKLPERRHASTVHAEQGAPRRPGRHDRAAKPRDQQSASVNAGDRTECRPPAAPARPWRALGSSGAAGPCGRAWRAASCPPRPPLAARRPPSGWRSGELLRVGPEPASPGRGRPAPAPRLLGPGNVGNRAGAEAPQPPAAAACTHTLGAGRAPAPTPPLAGTCAWRPPPSRRPAPCPRAAPARRPTPCWVRGERGTALLLARYLLHWPSLPSQSAVNPP